MEILSKVVIELLFSTVGFTPNELMIPSMTPQKSSAFLYVSRGVSKMSTPTIQTQWPVCLNVGLKRIETRHDAHKHRFVDKPPL